MPVVRRTSKVEAKATGQVASRLGGILQRRREARIGQKADAYAATSAPKARKVGGFGEVVSIPASSTPFSTVLDKSRYETRVPRPGKHIHVSDLLSKCIRKIALVERYELPARLASLSLNDSLTFAQGEAIHDVLKARAARGGARNLWGNWSCRCGSLTTKKPCLLAEVDASICGVCETPADRYQEIPMMDEELMIVGTPDVIMYLPEFDAFHITELKSIAHDRWTELIQPIPDHILQTMLYWFLMNRKGYKLTSRPSVVYATKGWLFNKSPIKEFSFDAATAIKRLDPYLEDARALKQARAGGRLPARTVCASIQAPEAKKCEACQVCFKGSDDSPKTISISEALRGRSPAGTPHPRR